MSSRSDQQLKAFIAKVQANTSLQEKLKAAAANAVDANAVAAIAKEAGFSISADDINKAQFDSVEISEEELEGVAGGVVTTIIQSPAVYISIKNPPCDPYGDGFGH
ncbi:MULTISPECIES: Nif11-like leader peptide family natural product precursor [unclassified Prochlorococcus]|uniref:Nif11-like leader peptide family natural product precursor n=1 Tax=unclassified Prochlorococcus TaxID=2627481 RepID=UPI0009DE0181|nr:MULTISPECIES: Nif11-like leader peptide family natural product precursor [unclassified Prochlorococcus]